MYNIKTIELITIEPTSHCNARCPQCDRFDLKNKTIVPLGHLDVGILNKNVNPKFLPNLKCVNFEGNCGDTMMHYDPIGLIKIYQDIKKVRVVTNGSMRDINFFKELANFKNLEIVFSIDGLFDTNHLYRQNTNFNKIIKNATAFINSGGNATWKFIVFEHNEHQIDEVKKLSKDIGFNDLIIEYTDRSWYYGDTFHVYNNGVYKFDLHPSKIVKESGKFKNVITDYSNKVINSLKDKQLPIKCPWESRNEIFIEHLGHVIPCCLLSNDLWLKNNSTNFKFLRSLIKNLESININIKNIEEIINSDFFKN